MTVGEHRDPTASPSSGLGRGARLPLLLGIGAMRAGTTTLHHHLADHPAIAATTSKEVHYFDRNLRRGDAWYEAQFRPDDRTELLADVTPNYLYDPDAPGHAARYGVGRDVSAVAILRDPVQRAYSHYLQKVSYGTEPLSFADAVAREPERLERSASDRALYSYVDRGRYLRQLQRWAEALGRDRLHVVVLEDLAVDAGEVWARLCRFAGVEPHVASTARTRVNSYVAFRSPALRRVARRLPSGPRQVVSRLNVRRAAPPPLAEVDRHLLRSLFEDEVAALSDWMGRDLAEVWWHR